MGIIYSKDEKFYVDFKYIILSVNLKTYFFGIDHTL
jgi:hypothetical protein